MKCENCGFDSDGFCEQCADAKMDVADAERQLLSAKFDREAQYLSSAEQQHLEELSHRDQLDHFFDSKDLRWKA